MNCIPLDSALYATVDWPSLRVWATPAGGSETIYYVPLTAHAAAIAGSYQCAYADFTLSGTVVAGDYVGLAFLTEAYTYQMLGGDTLASAALAITNSVNAFSALLEGDGERVDDSVVLHGRGVDCGQHGGGERESVRGVLVFDGRGYLGRGRADLRSWNFADYLESDAGFQCAAGDDYSGSCRARCTRFLPISFARCAGLTRRICRRARSLAANSAWWCANWTVTGTNRTYSVAGPGSRRMEDHDASMVFSGSWTEVRGNYSGGTIHTTTTPGDSLSCNYQATQSHTLYAGLRYTGTGGVVSISVDGAAAVLVNTGIPGEDALFRYSLGSFGVGSHTVVLTHAGVDWDGGLFRFFRTGVGG